MNFWRWSLIAVLVFIFSFSLILACGDDDDDDDDDDTTEDDDDAADDDDMAGCTITDICTLAYNKCEGNDGWTSIDECADGGWFGRCSGTMDEDAYMACTCACFNADDSCDDFINNCEIDCWNANCAM